MIKDSRSYEVQIIDAVRSVNRALGGTYGTSSAINKTEFNQYEVQLIDAIKGIGRTLSGKGLSLAGGGAANLSGYATVAQFQDLSRRVTILENESFFRLVDGNVTLKEQYQNLWVPGWLAAGGIGSDGGGGVSYLCELEDVYHTSGSGVLRADGTDAVPGDSLVYNSTLGWVAAPVSGGGGSGTVTGIKMNGNTLSPSATGIVDLGTVITSLSGYATEQWVGQQGFLTASALSGYATQSWVNQQGFLTSSDLSSYATRAWVQEQGYLTYYTETDPTVPAWAKAENPLLYVGYSQVQTAAQAQYLFGIPYINATNSASSKSRIIWDSTNEAWHFYGNIYADGWVSAGGIGSSGGGGGSTVEISNLLSSGTRIATITVDGTDYDILAPNNSGTVTSVKLGNTSYNPVNGVVSLPAYPTTLPASDVYSWAKASSKPSYSFSELTSHPSSISGYGITDAKIQNGVITLGSNTITPLTSVAFSDLTSHPTTLAGYGITDAKIANGIITLGGNTITPLTSHQTIYKLTLNDGTFTAGEYTPNSAAKTFNIPTTLDHIADGSNRKLSDYVTLHTTQTIDGAKTFSGNPVTIASSSGLSVHASSYIDIGDARLVYDSGSKALHVTVRSGASQVIGFFADGFVSAGGVGGQSTAFVDLESNQTIGGNKTFTGITTLGNGISFSSDEINYGSRLYIQYNSNDLCLTKGGKTIIGTYPGSGAVGGNKLYVDGSAIATSWNTSSDARLKDDIAYLSKSDAVEKLMGLKPASWKWNSGLAKGHTATGFIAQEVEPVLPFMVTGEDYKGLAYQMLHAYEVSAIQSHEVRIRQLEKENDSLRKEIERLKS